MQIYKTNKSVLSFKNNSEKFLSGLTSNTLDAPNNAFLTIHGRIVATFDQLQIGEDEFFILIEKPFVDDVLRHIDRYAKLSGVKVEQRDDHVYFDLGGDVSVKDDGWVIPQKKGKLIITNRTLDSNVSQEEFTLFRLQNNVPVHGIDYKDEMLLNVSTEDFVSFTKGCFLGQEPISKVYNRSKPSRKLVVKNEEECTQEEKDKLTSKSRNPEIKKVMGFVFIKND